MAKFLEFTFLGLTSGVLLALAAAGLVLTYTTSGIFNFSHGAVAMFASFAYWQATNQWGWNPLLAFIIVALVATPLLQVGIYHVIMRRLNGLSEITKTVVSVAVMIALWNLSEWLWNPSYFHFLPLPFGQNGEWKITISGQTAYFQYFGVLCVAITLGVAVAGSVLFKRSRAGLAMRAVVDSPSLLSLNGGNPNRIALISWAISGAFAGTGGILIAQYLGNLDATSLTVFVLGGAITAAIIGRLKSIPLTVVGGIVIGLGTAYFNGYAPQSWSNWSGGWVAAIPIVILFVALFVLPQNRLRGASLVKVKEQFAVPSMKNSVVAGLSLIAFFTALSYIMGSDMDFKLASGVALSLVGLSVVVLTGFSGQINLAPIALGSVGAFVAYHHGIIGPMFGGVLSLWGILLGVLATVLVGSIVALPALRLQGIYLAMASLGFGLLMTFIIYTPTGVQTIPLLHWHVAFFVNGSLTFPGIKVGPWLLSTGRQLLIAFTVMFVVTSLCVVRLRRGSLGRRMIALKDSEAAVATLGQRIVILKLAAFGISAALAGLGTILFCVSLQTVQASNFNIFAGIGLFMAVVIGGYGSVSGALFGGIGVSVGLSVIAQTFFNLSVSHPSSFGPVSWSVAGHLALLMPALIGINIAKAPGGQAQKTAAGYVAVVQNKVILAVTLGALTIAYLLALTKVWGNWWFVLAFCVIGVISPLTAQRISTQHAAGTAPATTGELVGQR